MKRLTHGSGEGVGDSPVVAVKAKPQRDSRHRQFLGPFCQGLRTPVVGNATIRPRVVGLLSRGGPSAVGRIVRAVIVDAFDCSADGSRPHVVKKTGEVVQPLRADVDTPVAIARPFGITGISASRFHLDPGGILSPTQTAQSMSRAAQRQTISAQAPATLSFSAGELVRGHSPDLPALAPADPYSFSAAPFALANDGESLENMSNQVGRHVV